MRKLVLITTAVAALAVAGIAIAHGGDSKSVTAVSATFTATTVSVQKTSSCTATNGHVFATTRATYTGTATGPAELSGPITLDTESLVDTTSGDGAVSGKLQIDAAGGRTDAHFDAVLHGGTVAGLAEGHTGSPHTALVANISGAFAANTGFAAGSKIGGGTAGGFAVEVGPGGCKPPKPAPPAKPDRIEVHGGVTNVATGTITAGGVTCTIPAGDLQNKVNDLHLQSNQQVEMQCTSSGGTNTLVKIEAKHQGKGKDH